VGKAGCWRLVVLASVGLAGCSGHGGEEVTRPQADDDFTCAALIGAADRLMGSGRLPASLMGKDQALLGAMSHLNAWAIPRKLPEAEAFAQVARERDRLIGSLPADEIGRRASACADSARGS